MSIELGGRAVLVVGGAFPRPPVRHGSQELELLHRPPHPDILAHVLFTISVALFLSLIVGRDVELQFAVHNNDGDFHGRWFPSSIVFR